MRDANKERPIAFAAAVWAYLLCRPSSQSISIGKNIAANALGQGYVIIVGLVAAPLLLAFMGAESFGLVGFFTAMGVWFQLLDLGLTPTLAREAARFHDHPDRLAAVRTLLRVLEILFSAISLLSAVLIAVFSRTIALRWLNIGTLPLEQVSLSLALMGATIPLRWLSGLYKGLVNGFERQDWLALYGVVVATLRYLGALVVLAAVGKSPVVFFDYQLAIAVLELAWVMIVAYRLLGVRDRAAASFTWVPLLKNLRFSIAIAFTASAWIVVMQADKFILSAFLRLDVYGVFTLATMAAAGINMINAPFNQALLPRLTSLWSADKSETALRLYCDVTEVVCAVSIPIVCLLAFFPRAILFAWTGNAKVAASGAAILALYSVGNFCASLHSFIYYLQYANGNLRMHFRGHAALLAFLVPAYYFGAKYYGALGTGTVWLLANGLYVAILPLIVHRAFKKGLHSAWLFKHVVPAIVPTVLVALGLSAIVTVPVDRFLAVLVLVGIGLLLSFVAVMSSDVLQRKIRAQIFHFGQ